MRYNCRRVYKAILSSCWVSSHWRLLSSLFREGTGTLSLRLAFQPRASVLILLLLLLLLLHVRWPLLLLLLLLLPVKALLSLHLTHGRPHHPIHRHPYAHHAHLLYLLLHHVELDLQLKPDRMQ